MSPTSANAAASNKIAPADGSPPVTIMLRLEALAVLAASLTAFAGLGVSWWWYAALILVPDLSAIGYAGGSKVGSWCYDLVHTYIGRAALGVIGCFIGEPMVMAVAAVWFSHIGFDRLIGYGLKFAGNPRDTHLSRVAIKGI